MRKGIYVHGGNTADVINLYFDKDAVTLRTFIRVRNGRELDILKRRNLEGQDITSILAQQSENPAIQFADVQGEGENSPLSQREMQEKALKAKFDLAKASALNSTDLTKSAKNLEGRIVNIDGNYFIICKQTTFFIEPNLWEPYSEVCMTLMKNPGRFPDRHLVAFFDRNAHTYNGREEFHQFHTKFKLSDSYIAFRWFVLPGTNLLTAPVICNPIPKLITNLDMGSEVITGSGGIETKEQRKRVNAAVEKFKEYWIPKVQIVGPSQIKADDVAEFELKCVHQDGKVCPDDHEYVLEALSGYAPHRRITVVKGHGKFRIIALGLKAGEKLRFKINDKYWTGRAEKTLTVV